MADLSKTVKSMTRNEMYHYYLINEYDDCMPPDASPHRKMHEECRREKANLARRKSDILPRETVATKKAAVKTGKAQKAS